MSPRKITFDWTFPVDASPEALWPLLSDSNRLNFEQGNPTIRRQAFNHDEHPNGREPLEMDVMGMCLRYEETPFEWVAPKTLRVRREFQTGMMQEFFSEVSLEPAGTGSTVRVVGYVIPANTLGTLFVQVHSRMFGKPGFEKLLKHYEAICKDQPKTMIARTPPPLSNVARGRIEAGLQALQQNGHTEEEVTRLRQAVAESHDLAALRLRPYALAALWGLPRKRVLEMFLRATRLGLLDLQWNLLCPLCRGSKTADPSLGIAGKKVHCQACNIDFTGDFQKSIELTFRPSAAIRTVQAEEYCTGGPGVTPHIIVRQLLQPGEAREVNLRLLDGEYRLRTFSSQAQTVFRMQSRDHTVEPLAPVLPLRLGADGWDVSAEPAPAPVLRLINDSAEEHLFMLERTEWDPFIVSGQDVTTLQTFRDLFAKEALRPGEEFEVGFMTFLFTDLMGSTAFYNEMGDAPAFGRVMGHFDLIKKHLDAHDGAIVKTIGDAVMGVFAVPEKALAAMVAVQKEYQQRREEFPCKLRVGIHSGPAIVVNQNDRLDYFGRTINFASRLEGQADGDEIVLSEVVYNDPAVQAYFQAHPTLQPEPFRAEIKGFDGSLPMVRLFVKP